MLSHQVENNCRVSTLRPSLILPSKSKPPPNPNPSTKPYIHSHPARQGRGNEDQTFGTVVSMRSCCTSCDTRFLRARKKHHITIRSPSLTQPGKQAAHLLPERECVGVETLVPEKRPAMSGCAAQLAHGMTVLHGAGRRKHKDRRKGSSASSCFSFLFATTTWLSTYSN